MKTWELKPGFNQDQEPSGGGMSPVWRTQGGGFAVPVQSPLTYPTPQEPQQPQPGQFEQPQGQQPAQPRPGPVPYERFQERNQRAGQADDLERRLQEREQTVSQLQALVQTLMGKKPGAEGGAPDPDDKAAVAEFYRDPKGYNDKKAQQLEAKLEERFTQVQEGFSYEMDKRMVRGLHGDNSDIEQQMVAAIQQYDLKRLGPSRAVRTAYRMVTGQELPASLAGVQAQSLKTRAQQPGNGGGNGQGQGLTREALAGMSLSDFAKDPEGHARRLMAAVTTTP